MHVCKVCRYNGQNQKLLRRERQFSGRQMPKWLSGHLYSHCTVKWHLPVDLVLTGKLLVQKIACHRLSKIVKVPTIILTVLDSYKF
jgi:hypothetical protein